MHSIKDWRAFRCSLLECVSGKGKVYAAAVKHQQTGSAAVGFSLDCAIKGRGVAL